MYWKHPTIKMMAQCKFFASGWRAERLTSKTICVFWLFYGTQRVSYRQAETTISKDSTQGCHGLGPTCPVYIGVGRPARGLTVRPLPVCGHHMRVGLGSRKGE